ncbi:hypothetical protein HDU85_005928 [Gaertneriomyces sp. JEL0708]|nr:hypothetical protein HDU85_005928 [Gaertneriomyces sp. JEL0708]
MIRVVIVGQDPYDKPEQATGVAFSIPTRVPKTETIKSIERELSRTYDYPVSFPNGDLRFWCEQGVIMLNVAMSVAPFGNSDPTIKKHYPIWRGFIVSLLSYINTHCDHVVFMFWGAEARTVMLETEFKQKNTNLYIEAAHPTNRTGQWLGNNNFGLANDFLESTGREPVRWVR